MGCRTPRTAEASAGHGDGKQRFAITSLCYLPKGLQEMCPIIETQLFATYASFREQHLSEAIQRLSKSNLSVLRSNFR